MPPRFEPPDENEILQLAKRLQSGGVVSQRTVFVTTIASAASGLLAVIYGTWFVTDRLKDFTHEVALIRADVASLRVEVRKDSERGEALSAMLRKKARAINRLERKAELPETEFENK